MSQEVPNPDWAGIADWISDNLFEAHRGVLRRGGRLVVFGNDGYRTPAVKREAELMRAWLEARGYAVERLATGGEEYAWAMVAVPPAGPVAVEPVENALWECYAEAKGLGSSSTWGAFRDCQQKIAVRTCDAHRHG
jgi:hypothetical protein